MRIKDYWEKNPPQVWYSDKEPLSNEWFNEIEYKRYKLYYPYLPEVAEFENHPGETVLEVGVGVGTDLLQYAKNGSRVFGIDLTERAVELTKKNLSRHNTPLNISIDSVTKLPFNNSVFDLVFCFGVLHHVLDTEKAINEIYRVLKPNGKAIVMLYAPGWKHFVKRIFIQGMLRGDLFRLGYRGLINKHTEVNGNSPLTKVYFRPRKLFKKFGEAEVTRHRLGEYFDYAPYNSWKFPRWFVNLLYLFNLEAIVGENWIIKATKGKKQKLSFWKTLLKP